MSNKITSKKQNYSQWYIDIILNAKLADYGPTKGSMVIRPYGFAIWDNIQKILDARFKETGHVNAYFPLLIPQSYLQKEAEHVKGFSPETAVVTIGGNETLEEPLIIRPTSETIIWKMYSKWIQSYRDLPLLINQWANVLRWEKRTRLFLRTSEFLWQEGHTAHAAQAEAVEEAERMIDLYKDFVEHDMALSVVMGRKSESERFAGAVESYAIEAMMQDKKALQLGTSHFLGQNFSKAFDVLFQTQSGTQEYPWATSWGVSTRLIGALIMAHADDSGLILPPKIAPIEIVIISIITESTKKSVLPVVNTIYEQLKKNKFKVVLDNDAHNSPGWKFAEWELKGVPLRIECGARDIAKECCTVVRRDTKQKTEIKIQSIVSHCNVALNEMQKAMFEKTKQFRADNTKEFSVRDDLLHYLQEDSGFAIIPWDGDRKSERFIKEKTSATSRVIVENIADGAERCVMSGKPAQYRVIFSKSY